MHTFFCPWYQISNRLTEVEDIYHVCNTHFLQSSLSVSVMCMASSICAKCSFQSWAFRCNGSCFGNSYRSRSRQWSSEICSPCFMAFALNRSQTRLRQCELRPKRHLSQRIGTRMVGSTRRIHSTFDQGEYSQSEFSTVKVNWGTRLAGISLWQKLVLTRNIV